MICRILAVLCMISLLCMPVLAEFRVGDSWQPIPFFAGQFHISGQGGGWGVTVAPPVFLYKDLGDTVLIDISMTPQPISEATTALVIMWPDSIPAPIDNMRVGLCALKVAGQKTLAHYELYPTGLVIWPITGMFPENKFPYGSIGVSLQLEYRY